MRVAAYKVIATATGDNPVAVAQRLRDWAKEPLGGIDDKPLWTGTPIMVAAYIASENELKVALESGN